MRVPSYYKKEVKEKEKEKERKGRGRIAPNGFEKGEEKEGGKG